MNHDEIWDNIPWFVNGRVDDAQRTNVEVHLRSCEACRREVAMQRQVQQAIANDKRIDCVPGVSFQRLWERIASSQESAATDVQAACGKDEAAALPVEAVDSNAPRAVSAAPRGAVRHMTRWLTAAVVVEAVGITALGAMLSWQNGAPQAPPAVYRTVTSAAPAADGGIIRAVFAPGLPLGELQKLLERSHLQIVAGPTEAGVYTLAATASIERSQVESSLTRLRAAAAVQFAEPIGSAIKSAERNMADRSPRNTAE